MGGTEMKEKRDYRTSVIYSLLVLVLSWSQVIKRGEQVNHVFVRSNRTERFMFFLCSCSCGHQKTRETRVKPAMERTRAHFTV